MPKHDDLATAKALENVIEKHEQLGTLDGTAAQQAACAREMAEALIALADELDTLN
jgi:hypothetical protein